MERPSGASEKKEKKVELPNDKEITKRMHEVGVTIQQAIDALEGDSVELEKCVGLMVNVGPKEFISFLLRKYPEKAIKAVIDQMERRGTINWDWDYSTDGET